MGDPPWFGSHAEPASVHGCPHMRRPTAVLTRDDAPLTGVSPSPFGMTAADLVKPLPSRALVHAALIVILGPGAVVVFGAPFNRSCSAIREGSPARCSRPQPWRRRAWGRAPRGRTDALRVPRGDHLFEPGCMIVRLKLSGAVIGSVWQPSIPVFTSLIV